MRKRERELRARARNGMQLERAGPRSDQSAIKDAIRILEELFPEENTAELIARSLIKEAQRHP